MAERKASASMVRSMAMRGPFLSARSTDTRFTSWSLAGCPRTPVVRRCRSPPTPTVMSRFSTLLTVSTGRLAALLASIVVLLAGFSESAGAASSNRNPEKLVAEALADFRSATSVHCLFSGGSSSESLTLSGDLFRDGDVNGALGLNEYVANRDLSITTQRRQPPVAGDQRQLLTVIPVPQYTTHAFGLGALSPGG